MRTRYRISPEGRRSKPSDAEIASYRDPKRLQYNYHRASGLLHRRPIYKDPKAFLALLLIVLVVWLIAEAEEKERASDPAETEQVVPGR